MNIEKEKAFECHVLVCVNRRDNGKKSCGNDNGLEIRAELKKAVKKRYPDKKIRVSQTGCLGLCAKGPNILIYPQDIHLANVKSTDIESVLKLIDEVLK